MTVDQQVYYPKHYLVIDGGNERIWVVDEKDEAYFVVLDDDLVTDVIQYIAKGKWLVAYKGDISSVPPRLLQSVDEKYLFPWTKRKLPSKSTIQTWKGDKSPLMVQMRSRV